MAKVKIFMNNNLFFLSFDKNLGLLINDNDTIYRTANQKSFKRKGQPGDQPK